MELGVGRRHLARRGPVFFVSMFLIAFMCLTLLDEPKRLMADFLRFFSLSDIGVMLACR